MAGPATPEHLIQDHGMDPKVIRKPDRDVRGLAARHFTLQMEMQHSADHARRKVGHTHD